MSYTKSKEAIPFPIVCGAITATATRGGGSPQYAGEIVACEFVDAVAITGDNTNRYALSVNKGTVASPTAMATIDFLTGTDSVAHQGKALTLSTTLANKRFTTTDKFHVVLTKNGTATNLTFATVVLHIIPIYDYGAE